MEDDVQQDLVCGYSIGKKPRRTNARVSLRSMYIPTYPFNNPTQVQTCVIRIPQIHHNLTTGFLPKLISP